jgi:hypothetical protein
MKKIIIAFMLAVVSLTGCSNSNRPSDMPTLFPCVVMITQEGSPLNGANVMLIPMPGTQDKYQASAVTDGGGKATLVTYGFDGIPAGKYKVCIRKVISDEKTGAEFQTVEQQYAIPDSSPHEIEITGKKMPPMSFDVGKPVKIKK